VLALSQQSRLGASTSLRLRRQISAAHPLAPLQ
jgi:hypothetical protein